MDKLNIHAKRLNWPKLTVYIANTCVSLYAAYFLWLANAWSGDGIFVVESGDEWWFDYRYRLFYSLLFIAVVSGLQALTNYLLTRNIKLINKKDIKRLTLSNAMVMVFATGAGAIHFFVFSP